MLDVYQIILWAITYIFIVIAGCTNRKNTPPSIPYMAGVLNFSWEICALYQSRGFWGHVLWLALDVAIVYINFRKIQSNRNRLLYVISILINTLLLLYVFMIPNGMLFSVFIIDLIMAICFLVDRDKLSPKLKIPIAFTKLLGDLFAGMYYAPDSWLVAILAIFVFFCNISYLYLCIEETGFESTATAKNKKTTSS